MVSGLCGGGCGDGDDGDGGGGGEGRREDVVCMREEKNVDGVKWGSDIHEGRREGGKEGREERLF